MYNFQIANDSILVIVEGKPVIVRKGDTNFKALRDALVSEDWPAVTANLTASKSIAEWLRSVPGFVINQNDEVVYKGDALPASFADKIKESVAKGESPEPLLKFWERLQRNPSSRSVAQLWPFLGHCGIPLTKEGQFLAYKSVRQDFLDHHSGTVLNTVGSVHEMPRNKISDDPEQTCHFGFHVGALKYAKDMYSTGRIVICRVDPEHVVCVPNDFSATKMRVCKYVVEGHYVTPLSNTQHEEEPEYTSDEFSLDEGFIGTASEDEANEPGLADVKSDGPWAMLDDMDAGELMKESIAKLRAYAGHGLKIVGASKIPGGKASLVKRILKIRNS